MGAPLPGETMVIAAAVYAATTHRLDIGILIAAVAAGAILGDNLGYWIGRQIGNRFLLRYGRFIKLTEARIKLGRYLFLRYGGRIVFLRASRVRAGQNVLERQVRAAGLRGGALLAGACRRRR
jgi:membrane protein DedA with SNARE-associated domain